MLAIIQEIASKSYTFREVAAYVTIAVCMSFSVGFLLAAFTRIFKEKEPTAYDYVDWSKIPSKYDRAVVNDMGGFSVCASNGHEPYPVENGGWVHEGGWPMDFQNYRDAIIGPLPLWRESLRRRPS